MKYMVMYDEAESWSGPSNKFKHFDSLEDAQTFMKGLEEGTVYYKVRGRLFELIADVNPRTI